MKQRRNETMVQVLLYLIGISTTLAIVPLFFPLRWMMSIHAWLGLGDAPEQPIFEYMARSLCIMYFTHGVLVLRIAKLMDRCWNLIPMVSAVNVFVGLALLVTDLAAGMPSLWTCFEGPPIMLVGVSLRWFHKQATLDRSLL